MGRDVAQLRERADHLFAIALRARERGQIAVAEELTQLAAEVLDHAADIEHSGTSVTVRRGIG
jgi:hypothetical protein